MIYHPTNTNKNHSLGGKADALLDLQQSSEQIPPWFAITEEAEINEEQLIEAAGNLNAKLFAVRSSAKEEDGNEHSFAGQFSTKLFVPLKQLWEAVDEVKASNQSMHLKSYQEANALAESSAPTVIVQAMLEPESAGVAFSQDPLDTKANTIAINAVWGVGSALVSGEVDADHWKLVGSEISHRQIAKKKELHRPDHSSPEGVKLSPLDSEKQEIPCLTDKQIQEVAALAKRCEKHFGCPQDIEWAYENKQLYLLQSRPITTLKQFEGELNVWDNSNIAESYSGITSPLTFSFAKRAYEHVYREFCKILSVPSKRIRKHDDVFPNMLGHIHGHVYYNLNSWYNVLALLPGFSINREFMEQMMGVKEPMPHEIVEKITASTSTSKLSDILALGKTLLGLMQSHRRLQRTIDGFYQRLNQALAPIDLTSMSPAELVEYYKDLEDQLLKRWDAPLINDFLAMIFFGVLGKMCTKWLGDPSLHNHLLLDCGEIISAEPPRMLQQMASILRSHQALLARIQNECSAEQKERHILSDPDLASSYQNYLDKFGDRCLEELKLESPTLLDKPDTLINSIINLANSAPRKELKQEKLDVESKTVKLSLVKRKLFHWVVKHAREKIRNRENLRFERTRLFGRVRQIMLQLGRHYKKANVCSDHRDVFMLTLEEALNQEETMKQAEKYQTIIEQRKAEQESFITPPDRFETRGEIRPELLVDSKPSADALTTLQGIGACPGIIKGRVRVVKNPQEASIQQGEILVAQQTDPGWVVLFPSSSAILVERGSLLSHSAIVARELQIPCIVSIPAVTTQLQTGDLVQMNGATGAIEVLERNNATT